MLRYSVVLACYYIIDDTQRIYPAYQKIVHKTHVPRDENFGPLKILVWGAKVCKEMVPQPEIMIHLWRIGPHPLLV